MPRWRALYEIMKKDKQMAARQKAVKVGPADSAAPDETFGEAERVFFERFRIKPETFAPDAKERWEQQWDRLMERDDSDPETAAEKAAIKRLFSKERGINFYVDIDWSAPDEVLHPQVLVNMCYFLYLSDDELEKDWNDVEQLYVAVRDRTPLPDTEMDVDAEVYVDVGADETPPETMSVGAPAEPSVNAVNDSGAWLVDFDATTPEGMPRWKSGEWSKLKFSKADKQAMMITGKRALKTLAVGASGAAIGSVVAPVLAPLAASAAAMTGLGATATWAAGIAATGATYAAGTLASDLAITAATNHGWAMVGEATSLLLSWERQLAVADHATYSAKYFAMAEKQKENIAAWLVKNPPAGETVESVKAQIFFNPAYGTSSPKNIIGKAAAELFKKGHLEGASTSGLFGMDWGSMGGTRSTAIASETFGEFSNTPGRVSFTAAATSVKDDIPVARARANLARDAFKRKAENVRFSGAFKEFMGAYGLQIALSIPTGFMQQRYVKDEASIQWVTNALAVDATAFTYRADLDNNEPLTTFDVRLRDRHETICKTSDKQIEAYLKADRDRKPYGTGILRDSKKDLPRRLLQWDSTKWKPGDPEFVDGTVGDALMSADVADIDANCTRPVHPDEERAAVVRAYELVLSDIKDVLDKAVGKEWKRKNGWLTIAIKPLMIELEPAVERWLELDKRLFKDRFLRDMPRVRKQNDAEYERRLKDKNGACKKFMSNDDRQKAYGPLLAQYGALEAQNAIDDGKLREETANAAAESVRRTATFYGFPPDEVSKYSKLAGVAAQKAYDAHMRQNKADAAKKYREDHAAELEKAKKAAQEAGDEVVGNLLYDESVTDDELAKQVADAAYDAAISYPSVVESVVLKLSYKAAEAAMKKRNKLAADRAKQRAKEDAEDQRKEKRRTEAVRKQQEREERAEKAAEKKAQDAARKAAAKAAAAEEEREKAPAAVMNLAEAEAAARVKAWSTINEQLETNPEIDPVELEGLAAMAAADEVRRFYTDMPARVIRQVGLEAASEARRQRANWQAGNDGPDQNEPRLAPLSGGAGPVFGAGEAMDAMRMGASASVVADVFARLSL